jgi:hypothetical protein
MMTDAPGDFPKRRLKVNMAELSYAFSDSGLELSRFLDLETGEIILIQDDLSRYLEQISDEYGEQLQAGQDLNSILETLNVPDWRKEAIRDAVRVEAGFGKRFIRVPAADSYEGYRDMEDFIATLENPRLQNQLELAIRGRGAFRRFKDVLLEYPAERQSWFEFQDARLMQRVLGWLDSNGIEPIE